MSLGSSNEGKRDGRCMWHEWGREIFTGSFRGKLEERIGRKYPGVDGKKIRTNLREGMWDKWPVLDSSYSGEGQMAGCCECGNEPPGSIKYGNFSWLAEQAFIILSTSTLFHEFKGLPLPSMFSKVQKYIIIL